MSGADTPPVEVVFLDCDDCLYQNSWATAEKITKSIAAYTEKLGVTKEQAYELYKTHGTCLKGLLVEGRIDEAGVEDFLHEVHQIDYSDIAPDPKLREILKPISESSWVFTASTREHAQRCLDNIGIKDLKFRGIIDTRTCKLETKHSRSSFEVAMSVAGVTNPAACLFCDDSVKNIVAAKAVGWRTVLVGKVDRDTGAPVVCDAADFHVASLHELPEVLPELFDVANMRVTTKKRVGFYIQSAKTLLQETVGKDGAVKRPFKMLHITGLGGAIGTAVAAAAAVEREGLGAITKIETSFESMDNAGVVQKCARIRITVQRK